MSVQPWNQISLRDFRLASDGGKVGEKNGATLKLSGRTVSLVKNKQSLTSEATKQALVRALTNAHATADFLSDVCKKLGLTREGDGGFVENKGAKPLSKALVKQILNAYETGEYTMKGTAAAGGEICALGGEKKGGNFHVKGQPGSGAVKGKHVFSKSTLKTTTTDGLGDWNIVERATFRVPVPDWELFDVSKIKDGKLNEQQLSYLEMNPEKTNGPVCMKCPNDNKYLQQDFDRHVSKEEAKNAATVGNKGGVDSSFNALELFLRRGDFGYEIGDFKISQENLQSGDVKTKAERTEAAAKQLTEALQRLFGDNTLMAKAFNYLFEGSLSLLGMAQQSKADAFCLGFDLKSADQSVKNRLFSKIGHGHNEHLYLLAS